MENIYHSHLESVKKTHRSMSIDGTYAQAISPSTNNWQHVYPQLSSSLPSKSHNFPPTPQHEYQTYHPDTLESLLFMSDDQSKNINVNMLNSIPFDTHENWYFNLLEQSEHVDNPSMAHLNLISSPASTTYQAGLATPVENSELICLFPGCGKEFSSKQSLKSHSTIHAEDKDKPFSCPICGSAFRRKHDLTRHHRSLHAVVKPFKCRFCAREYARSDALKRHLSSRAHSLPPSLTGAVAAASRQIPFPQYIWPQMQNQSTHSFSNNLE